MVSSRPEPGTEGRNGCIRNFSRANEYYVENFTEVEDNATNHSRGNISSEKDMTSGITSRVRPGIVDVTVRRENGETEIYSLESMTKRMCHRLLQDLRKSMLVDGQRVGYRTREATVCLQENLAFEGHTEALNGKPTRRDPNSSDSSDSGSSQSDREGRTVDLTRINTRKRARKSSLESARSLEELYYRSPENPPVVTRVSLKIADEKAVMAFYRRILADGQQTLCKKLAKWWIRAINPNKQTNYPYAKGSEKKPPWWPRTPPNNAVGVPNKGTTENGFVRHKEPDHLAKPERLTLLPYVLNQVTDPRNRTQFNCIDVTKLNQISMDSINNETTDKEKHESWRRYVNEIFQVARQQERYKDGEIDDTTAVNVLPSYDSWRKGPADEAEEDSKSDGEYDDDEYGAQTVLTPRSPFDQDLHDQIQTHPQSLGGDVKQEFSGFSHETRFRLNFLDGLNSQSSYRDVNDGTHQIQSQQPYGISTAPQSKSDQQTALMLQEPFRRHSNTSDRFSNQSPFLSFLPSTNMTQIANSHYQNLQPVFQFPPITSSPAGPVLPPPMSAPMTRPLADIPQFPSFNDAELFSRPTTAFQTSVRDTVLGNHGNLLQLSQQNQNFQDYLHNQDYGHNAIKQVMNLGNATRPEFIYNQENESNVSRSEFSYDVKRRRSLDSGAFDLDEMANGASNGHSGHVG